ncbi:hypothetical protein WS68_02020 [Burkholderia sp. TSV86]|nr:hypothetical protein WS68_02020 [Burkholderia sp. TSV86]
MSGKCGCVDGIGFDDRFVCNRFLSIVAGCCAGVAALVRRLARPSHAVIVLMGLTRARGARLSCSLGRLLRMHAALIA